MAGTGTTLHDDVRQTAVPTGVAVVEEPEDAAALALHLQQPGRRWPVAVVTVASGETAPFVDVNDLAKDLAGLVEVVVMPTADATWAFSREMPDNTQVYGGASRVYPVRPDWVTRPRHAPLRFAYSAHDRARVTDLLVADGMTAALSAGLYEPRSSRTLAPVQGTVRGIVGSRAFVTLDDGTTATLWEELSGFEGVPLERLVRRGQRVVGHVDPESRRLDLVRPTAPGGAPVAAGALGIPAVPPGVAAGATVLAQVVAAADDALTVRLVPDLDVRVARDAVTANDLDRLTDLFSAGDVLVARVVETAPVPVLSLLDVDDDETPLPAPALLPDGPPWLVPPPPPQLVASEGPVDLTDLTDLENLENSVAPVRPAGPAEAADAAAHTDPAPSAVDAPPVGPVPSTGPVPSRGPVPPVVPGPRPGPATVGPRRPHAPTPLDLRGGTSTGRPGPRPTQQPTPTATTTPTATPVPTASVTPTAAPAPGPQTPTPGSPATGPAPAAPPAALPAPRRATSPTPLDLVRGTHPTPPAPAPAPGSDPGSDAAPPSPSPSPSPSPFPAPAPAPTPAQPTRGVVRDLGLALTAARAHIAELERDLASLRGVADELARLRERAGSLEAEVTAAQVTADRFRLQYRTADRRRQTLERQVKAQTSAPVDAALDTRGWFTDPEEDLRFAVTTTWARRIPAGEKERWPLRDWTVGGRFLASLSTLGPVSWRRLAEVVVDVVVGDPARLGALDDHELREGEGGNAPARRRADGAVCHRAALQQSAPSARRLHYWVLGGTVELSRVVLHDDTTP